MGHGLAYLPGSGWAVLAILMYYVYAPVAARCPPATWLRRRRPLKVMRNVPPTALSIDLGELRMALWAWFKTSVMPFQLPIALQFM